MSNRDTIIVQLTLEVPAVETAVGKTTQAQVIVKAFDQLNALLGRQLRAVPVALIQQRVAPIEDPSQEVTYTKPKEPVVCAPEDWECGACGGKAAPESLGMFSGLRWIHTCGETYEERAAKEKKS
jgi:hypothetical protein